MVARSYEVLWQFAKNRLAVMVNCAGLTVHRFFSANDFGAEGFADGLMPEANSEDGNCAGEALNDGHTDSGLAWSARPGRNNDLLRPHIFNFTHADFIVSADFELLAELTEVLRQIIGKRIVVIDYQDHSKGHLFPLPLMRHFHRDEKRARLVYGLLVLLFGNRISNHAAACLNMEYSVFCYQRAKRDAGIKIARKIEIQDRASIDSSAGRFQLVNNFHGANFRRAAERSGGK